MPAIHQFLAGFTNNDAISNEAVALRTVFRSWGLDSSIFSEPNRILPQLRRETLDASTSAGQIAAKDVVILHLSIGSVVNDAFAALTCRKAIIYHNITPPAYFDNINKQTAWNLAKGREQLGRLSGAAEVNLADSAFNASELTAAGYRNVRVVPLFLDLKALDAAPDAKIMKRFNDGRTNILFVGRCVPNKKIEDLLTAFHYYNRTVDPNSRLIHVGSFAGSERYYYLLMTRAKELGIPHIHFAGSVPQAQLNAFYRCSRVFLCMSEHEGFCIPIIESMALGVPVMAFGSTAVPETMDGAGILFREKNFQLIAEMIGRLACNGPLRSAIIAGQDKRIERYRARNLEAKLRQHLSPLLE